MRLFKLTGAKHHGADVGTWSAAVYDEVRRLAETWFDRMRRCGADVRELLHDGHPTACVGDTAFGYVSDLRGHVNVGLSAELQDLARLLQSSGRFMRHVKVRWGQAIDAEALNGLIEQAYENVCCLRSGRSHL